MEFLGEKLSEAFLAVRNLWGEGLACFERVFSSETRPEKIKEWGVAVQNSGEKGLAWFAEVFPAEKINDWIDSCKLYMPVAASVVVVLVLFRFLCGGGPGKMMKAPGRNRRMPRASFESNPRGYFRELRGHK